MSKMSPFSGFADWIQSFETSYLLPLYVFCNVFANVGVQNMGYYMPIYSTWLLYGTTLMYTLMFAIAALVRQEDWRIPRDLWWVVLALGFFTSANGIFAQVSIPFVDPEITALITQISAPMTWICHPFVLDWARKTNVYRQAVSKYQVLAFVVIMAGLLFGSSYSLFHGSGSTNQYNDGVIWLLMTLFSALPTSFEIIFQEIAFDVKKMPKFVVLTYYNLLSLIAYMLWTPTTMIGPFGTCVDGDPDLDVCALTTRACKGSEVMGNQWDAFKCYFGDYDVVCCEWGGTFWVTIFVLFYFGSFSIGAYILQSSEKNGSIHIANGNAITSPLVSMYFWIPFVSGQGHSVFEWWILVSFIFIFAGNVLYENFKTVPNLEGDDHPDDDEEKSMPLFVDTLINDENCKLLR